MLGLSIRWRLAPILLSNDHVCTKTVYIYLMSSLILLLSVACVCLLKMMSNTFLKFNTAFSTLAKIFVHVQQNNYCKEYSSKTENNDHYGAAKLSF